MSVWKNEKFWCVVAGVVGPAIIKKIIKAPKTREFAVKGLAPTSATTQRKKRTSKLRYEVKNCLR